MSSASASASGSERLSRGHLAALAAAGLAVGLLAAVVVDVPGYMDADYYFATGRELSRGRGFSEPFLWNYLDDPPGLPHPSHLYWMPLASLLAAGSMGLFGESFRAAQLPFLLLTSALPLLTAALALRLTGRAAWARASGLLAAFSGFYLPFFVTTDAFGLYALLGGGLLWILAEAADGGRRRWWLAVGGLLGLCHLARADAPLMFLPAAYSVARSRERRPQALGLLLIGYLIFMAPWYGRNLIQVGAPLNPGGARILWTLSYDELFAYPAGLLTPQRWLAAGLPAHLALRLSSAGVMLQRALAENGLVFLAPFMLWGAVRQWSRSQVRIATLYLGALLAGLTLAFPAVGARGAYFHASAAVMPMLWSLAPVGIDAAARWAGGRRGWSSIRASRHFVGGAVLLAAALTLALLARRGLAGGWGGGIQPYSVVGARLFELDPARRPVAVNNPPGFYAQTERPAVVIPNGDASVLREVVQRYGAAWVVLEANHPPGLADLYARPAGLEWLLPVDQWPDASGRPVWLLAVRTETGP